MFMSRNNILTSLKEIPHKRNILLNVIVAPSFDDEEIMKLNSDIRRIVTVSKNFPLDILKIIRDRLSLEEGSIFEDSEIILEDSNKVIQDDEIKGLNNKKSNNKNTVLIVDDDSDTLYTVGEMVKEAGCNIAFASNGIECLSILRTMKPSLILLDIMMPVMDGFETIKRIKSENNYRSIPIYALTAKVMLSDKDVVIRNGFDDLIPKPVNAAELIGKIEKLIVKNAEIKIILDKE